MDNRSVAAALAALETMRAGATMPAATETREASEGTTLPSWMREPQMVPQKVAPQDVQETGSIALCLRGLPFSASEQDVLAFFAKHDVVECVSEGKDAVKMVLKASGKPSGQAIVQIVDRAEALKVVEVLNGQYMGTRYIEVFFQPESEKAAEASTATNGPASLTALSDTFAGATRPSQTSGLAEASTAPQPPAFIRPLSDVSALGEPAMLSMLSPPIRSPPATPQDSQRQAACLTLKHRTNVERADSNPVGQTTSIPTTPWDTWASTPSPGGLNYSKFAFRSEASALAGNSSLQGQSTMNALFGIMNNNQ